MRIALNEETGEVVPIGSEITDFRGDKAILVSVDRVRIPGKSGMITYELPDGKPGRCVYDKVFGLEVVEVI